MTRPSEPEPTLGLRLGDLRAAQNVSGFDAMVTPVA
jgi:hypothetical protein